MSLPTTTKNQITSNDTLMAEQLSAQYQRAIAGLVEQIKFGAMMAVLQETLFDSTRGTGNINRLQQKGEGLKGWLQTNCPEISIPTAWRWMSLAKGIKEHFQLGHGTDIAALLEASEDLSAKHQKIGEKLRTFLAGKSATQLLFDFRIGVPDPKKRGGYHGPAEPDTRTDEERRKEFLDNVRSCMGEFLGRVDNYVNREASWKELSRSEIVVLQGCLETAVDTVRDHVRNLHPHR